MVECAVLDYAPGIQIDESSGVEIVVVSGSYQATLSPDAAPSDQARTLGEAYSRLAAEYRKRPKVPRTGSGPPREIFPA